MRAILIDPTQRIVRGIELDITKLAQAFTGPSVVPIDVTSIAVDSSTVIFYDRNGVLKHPSEFFYIDGLSGPIWGKAILLAHQAGYGPMATKRRSRDIEAIVAFQSNVKAKRQ